MIYGYSDEDLVLDLLPHAGLVEMARSIGFTQADMASNRQELIDAIQQGTPPQHSRVADARQFMGDLLQRDTRLLRLLGDSACAKCFAQGNTLCHDGRAVFEYLQLRGMR